MRALAENSTDAAKEKHVPVIEDKDGGTLVRVGSVAHPMEADHYIEWIELLIPAADGGVAASYRAFLKPGDKSRGLFPRRGRAERLGPRALQQARPLEGLRRRAA